MPSWRTGYRRGFAPGSCGAWSRGISRYLEEAQLDATLLAIRAQERAGPDIVTDGEIRRESCSNHFATAQSGLDCQVLSELPGKTIILGVLDLADMRVERPEAVVDRVRRALPYVDASRIVLAPDCGMKYLPRDVADGKLQAMTSAAAILRRELGST